MCGCDPHEYEFSSLTPFFSTTLWLPGKLHSQSSPRNTILDGYTLSVSLINVDTSMYLTSQARRRALSEFFSARSFEWCMPLSETLFTSVLSTISSRSHVIRYDELAAVATSGVMPWKFIIYRPP